MVFLYAFIRPNPYQCQDFSVSLIWPLNIRHFIHPRCLYMNTQYNTEKIALEIYLPQHHKLTFVSYKIPDCLKINIDSTLDRYEVFRRRIYTEPGSEQDMDRSWVVQVVPIQILDRNKIARLNAWTDPVRSWFRTNLSSKQPIRKALSCPG